MGKRKKTVTGVSPQQDLVLCALKGNLHGCRVLLETSSVHLEMVRGGYTPLMAAVKANQPEIVRLFGKDGIAVKNDKGKTAIHHVSYDNLVNDNGATKQVLSLLIEYGADLFEESPEGVVPYLKVKEADPRFARELLFKSLQCFAWSSDYYQKMIGQVVPNGMTPLAFVVSNREILDRAENDPERQLLVDAAKFLIATGDTLFLENEFRQTPYQMLITKHSYLAQELLDFSLCMEVMRGDEEQCQKLLHSKANPNARLACQWLAEKGWFGPATALTLAVECGHERIADLLIEHGGVVAHQEGDGIDWALTRTFFVKRCHDVEKNLALQKAAWIGSIDHCGSALKDGADIETTIDPVEVFDGPAGGRTPLLWAIDYPDLILFLLGQGASPSGINADGWSALHFALMRRSEVEKDITITDSKKIRRLQGYDFVIDHLLRYGADPNQTIVQHGPFCGQSPLHFSCGEFLNQEAALLLAKRGADIYKMDQNGNRPIDLAGADTTFAKHLTENYEKARMNLLLQQYKEIRRLQQDIVNQHALIQALEAKIERLLSELGPLLNESANLGAHARKWSSSSSGEEEVVGLVKSVNIDSGSGVNGVVRRCRDHGFFERGPVVSAAKSNDNDVATTEVNSNTPGRRSWP